MSDTGFGGLDGPVLEYRKQKPAKGQDRADEFAFTVFRLESEKGFLKESKKADREKHLGHVAECEKKLEVARLRLVNAVKHRNMDAPLVFKASAGVVVVWRDDDWINVQHIYFEQGRGFED